MQLRGKSIRSWCNGSLDRSFMVDPLRYFSFQPVLHDWCNKCCGICYPVCGMMHIKETLLLKSSLCGGRRFPLSLLEWSFTICLTPYHHKMKCVECVVKQNISFLVISHFSSLPTVPILYLLPYLYLFKIQARCPRHPSYLECLSKTGHKQFLLVVIVGVRERRGCSGLTPIHWAFKNPLQVGAGIQMQIQYQCQCQWQIRFNVHIQSKLLQHMHVVGTHSSYQLGCLSKTKLVVSINPVRGQ